MIVQIGRKPRGDITLNASRLTASLRRKGMRSMGRLLRKCAQVVG